MGEQSICPSSSFVHSFIQSFINDKGQGEVHVHISLFEAYSFKYMYLHVFLFPVGAAVFHTARTAGVSSGAAGGGSLEVPEENLRVGG